MFFVTSHYIKAPSERIVLQDDNSPILRTLVVAQQFEEHSTDIAHTGTNFFAIVFPYYALKITCARQEGLNGSQIDWLSSGGKFILCVIVHEITFCFHLKSITHLYKETSALIA